MTTHSFLLTQENFHVARSAPPDANIVSFSQLRQAFFQQSFRGFSIKYVVAGQETYVVDGREHRVQAGEYLLTNPHCRGTGLVDSPETVTGICVDIRPAVLADVVGTLNRAGEPDGGADLAGFLQSADFYAQRFPGGASRLGQALAALGRTLQEKRVEAPVLDPDVIYTLAELYVDAYGDIRRQLTAIAAVKASTRQELHRRLMRGREFMEACFTRPIEVDDVARHAQLSKYHFFRLFKAAFGQSPHQFIIGKRLELGRDLLVRGRGTVSEIALHTGFADIFSFSKAFKKRFGMAPSAVPATLVAPGRRGQD